MNGFIVLIDCMSDNLPVGLFETRQDAIDCANRVGYDELNAVEVLFVIDSTPVCVSIVEMVGGVPVSREVVREDFDGAVTNQE